MKDAALIRALDEAIFRIPLLGQMVHEYRRHGVTPSGRGTRDHRYWSFKTCPHGGCMADKRFVRQLKLARARAVKA